VAGRQAYTSEQLPDRVDETGAARAAATIDRSTPVEAAKCQPHDTVEEHV